MTILQTILAALNWQVRVNENFEAVSPAGLFAKKASTTTGLTLGYYGGVLDGVSYSDGTHALTASTTRYAVAARATGVVSSATGTTNWNDTINYLRMGVAVVGTSTITSWTDWRQFAGGGGSSGTVAGSDKQVQYNNAGAFGAEAGFEYDASTNTLTVDKITLNGLLTTLASASGVAGVRIPHGTAPSSPTNGDVWTTTAGLYARINGATVGPYVATAGTQIVCIPIACGDETTACTTGTAKVTFRMPFAMTLTAVRGSLTTAPTGSTFIFDINEGGTTILSTKLSIDASEKTSTTAASAAVISDAALADDAEITIDFDQVGSSVAGAGPKVYLIGTI